MDRENDDVWEAYALWVAKAYCTAHGATYASHKWNNKTWELEIEATAIDVVTITLEVSK